MGRHEHNFWTWVEQYPDQPIKSYRGYQRRLKLRKWAELAYDLMVLILAVSLVGAFLILLGV